MLQTINGIDLLLVLVITALGYYCHYLRNDVGEAYRILFEEVEQFRTSYPPKEPELPCYCEECRDPFDPEAF